MTPEIACLACSVDPATASLLVPIAQATIISAPILLRGQIRRAAAVVVARHRGAVAAAPAEPRDRPVADGSTHEHPLDR